jgi:hypothetical protein
MIVAHAGPREVIEPRQNKGEQRIKVGKTPEMMEVRGPNRASQGLRNILSTC